MAYEYIVRDQFPMPDGRMLQRGKVLSDADVASLSNDDHEHKLHRHCIKSYVEDVAPRQPMRPTSIDVSPSTQ